MEATETIPISAAPTTGVRNRGCTVASGAGRRPALAMDSMPRVAATQTPMATAAMSRMISTDMRLPKPDEPNGAPEASACSGNTLFFQAAPLRPKPTSWA
jgi:hypothetical protein